MNFFNFLAGVLIYLQIAGCGVEDSVSTPLPQPVPQPRTFYIRKSTPGLEHQKTLIVGLPQAVAGVGQVHIRDRKSGKKIIQPSTAEGSFSGVLEVGLAAEVELQFETLEGISPVVLLSAAISSFGLQLEQTDVNGPPVVSPPDAQGMVTVTNGKDPQSRLVYATPASEILVSNENSSTVVLSTTDGNGGFEVILPGEVGDVIHLLLVDPAASEQTSDFLSFQVPGV